jgi:hypothetical protein
MGRDRPDTADSVGLPVLFAVLVSQVLIQLALQGAFEGPACSVNAASGLPGPNMFTPSARACSINARPPSPGPPSIDSSQRSSCRSRHLRSSPAPRRVGSDHHPPFP